MYSLIINSFSIIVRSLLYFPTFRKHRFLRSKRFLTHDNSYKNVIMAFGGDDDVTIASSTPEMRYGARDSSSGSISPSSSSVLSASDDGAPVRHGHSNSGGRRAADSGTVWMTNGSTSGCGPGAVTAAMQSTGGLAATAAGRWLTMMPPIDERLEDVYAAFKRQCDGNKRGKFTPKITSEKPVKCKLYYALVARTVNSFGFV